MINFRPFFNPEITNCSSLGRMVVGRTNLVESSQNQQSWESRPAVLSEDLFNNITKFFWLTSSDSSFYTLGNYVYVRLNGINDNFR